MYQWNYSTHREIKSFPVAPPYDPNIKNNLWKLSNAHFFFKKGISFNEFIASTEQLTTEETDRCRLQFLFFYEMLHEHLKSEFLKKEFFDITRNNSWILLVNFMINKAHKNILDFQKQCKNSPNDEHIVQLLSESLYFYYEGLSLIQMWSNDKNYCASDYELNTAKEILKGEILIAQEQAKLVALKPHYDNLNQFILTIDEIKSEIPQRLSQQLQNNHRINFSEFERVSYLLGNKHHLSKIVQDETFKEKEIKNYSYRILNDDEATQVKKVMINAFNATSGLFETGIINSLKQSLMLLDKEAYQRMERSHIGSEEQYENEVNLNKNRPKSLRLDLPEKEAFIKMACENMIFNNNYSLGLTKISDNFIEGFEYISQQLGLDNSYTQQIENHIIFSKYSDNLIIGKFNHQEKSVLAYQFNEVYENAISAFIVPNSMLEKEIPSLEYLQKNEEQYAISCFMSYGQMITDFKDDYIQEYFLKDTYKIIDNINVDLGTTVGIHS